MSTSEKQPRACPHCKGRELRYTGCTPNEAAQLLAEGGK